MINCNTGILGPGEYCESMYPVGLPKVDFFCRPGFAFDSMADAADQAKWDEAIAAGHIRVVRNIKDNEPQDVEASFIDTGRGEKIPNYPGIRGDKHMVLQSLEAHQYMYTTWNFQGWGLFKCDVNGILQGWKDKETGKIYPIDLSMLFIHPMQTRGNDNANYTIIEFQEADLADLDVNGFYWQPNWDIKKKKGLQVIQPSAGAIAANAFVATVNYEKPTTANNGSLITFPILGAAEANFVIEDQNGDILPTSGAYTITDNGDGTYAVDATLAGLTSGRFKIAASASFLYESDWVEISA